MLDGSTPGESMSYGLVIGTMKRFDIAHASRPE